MVFKNILYFLPAALIMVLIFIFSAMPGDESSEQSGFLLRVLEELIVEVTKEGVSLKTLGTLHLLIRKTAHLTEYACLAVSLSFGILHVFMLINKSDRKAVLLFSLATSFLYACTDELHQFFVPGRYGTFSDVLIDSCGALIGILVYFFLRRNKYEKV